MRRETRLEVAEKSGIVPPLQRVRRGNPRDIGSLGGNSRSVRQGQELAKRGSGYLGILPVEIDSIQVVVLDKL